MLTISHIGMDNKLINLCSPKIVSVAHPVELVEGVKAKPAAHKHQAQISKTQSEKRR